MSVMSVRFFSSTLSSRLLHTLTGLFLVLFLIFHLLTNSQAALFFDSDGEGFVSEVNSIHSLPYLVVIELLLLGVPFLLHMLWGLHYLLTSSYNSFSSDGSTPSLPYGRNYAYSWQRITAWLLLVAVAAHVFQMRIVNYASSAKVGDTTYYMQRVDHDAGLYTVAARLGAKLFDGEEIIAARSDKGPAAPPLPPLSTPPGLSTGDIAALEVQRVEQSRRWLDALDYRPLTSTSQRVAVAKDFGTATLLMVRETFKSPVMAVLYTIFVVAATYHAFNGLWSACISLGFTLNSKIQRRALRSCQLLMVLIALLGLAAIWGCYWITLKT